MPATNRIMKESQKFERIVTNGLKFGAHVLTTGGISNAVTNAYNIGCNSFAMFLKNPRRWDAAALKPEEIEKFKENCKKYNYDPLKDILPHGQYFINLCNPNSEAHEKSYRTFLDDLKRCESLGIGNYNLHPGSVLKGGDHEKGLKQLASYINKVHKETEFVKIVLENMASDNVVGCKLEDLRDVIEMIEDKLRVGVCIDTCHSFAAGYDLRTEESCKEFWGHFDEVIGYKYLSGIHLNDSKGPLLSNRDLHQNLGLGFLGLEAFRIFANNKLDAFKNIPIILETPYNTGVGDEHYGEEIKLLEWLNGKTNDDEEFKEKEQNFSNKGSQERSEQSKKFEKKQVKRAADKEKAAKGTKRAKKGGIDSFLKKN